MVNPVHLGAALLALCAHWGPAAGQSVYRCGESYSNQPCPGGVVVPVDDERSAAQRAESRAATLRDAKSADLLEKERLMREKEVARSTAAAPKPVSSPAQTQPKPRVKKPEIFKAVVPKKPGAEPPKKKKKKAASKAAKKTPA